METTRAWGALWLTPPSWLRAPSRSRENWAVVRSQPLYTKRHDVSGYEKFRRLHAEAQIPVPFSPFIGLFGEDDDNQADDGIPVAGMPTLSV
jgi:hypothetical protein